MRLDLVLGVAEHLLPARRVHDAHGFEVPVPDALLRAGERQREPLFALTQWWLRLLPLGNVPHDQLDSPIIPVAQFARR